MRRRGVLLLALLAGWAWLLSPATAASAQTVEPHAIDVLAVPTGPHARIDYLTGRLLHTASGRVIALPWPQEYQDSLQLLGRGPDGWIVVYHHTSSIYEVAPNGMAHLLFRYTQDGGYEGQSVVTLSTNHRLIAIRAADPGDAAHYTVYDLSGFVVGAHRWSSGWPVAFRGRSLYLPQPVSDTATTLLRWRVGHAPVDTGLPNVVLLDLAHDQFLRQVHIVPHHTGVWLMRVSHPHHGAGQVCLDCRPDLVQPTSFSPGGGSIAFRHATATKPGYDGETIRDTHVMKLRTVLRFDARVWNERWESSRHLLVEVVRQSAGQSLYAADKALLAVTSRAAASA